METDHHLATLQLTYTVHTQLLAWEVTHVFQRGYFASHSTDQSVILTLQQLL